MSGSPGSRPAGFSGSTEMLTVAEEVQSRNDASMTGHLWRRAALGLVLATALGLATPAVAVARDVPTEDAAPATQTIDASITEAVQQSRCRTSQLDPSLGSTVQIDCRKGGQLLLEYTFAIPQKAISLEATPVVDSVGTFGSSPGAEVYRSQSRFERGRATVLVGFVGAGSWTLNGVQLDLEVPTRVDTRPCVTKGEWAFINALDSGVGGSLEQIADVFNTVGKQTHLSKDYGGFREQVRTYRRCDSNRVRKVEFHQIDGGEWFSYWG